MIWISSLENKVKRVQKDEEETRLTTYEMVALADKNGKTYENEDLRYSRERGFHDKSGKSATIAYEMETEQLNVFIHDTNWEEMKPRKITIAEIETFLGYPIEIIQET